jgi:hypothetical protein
MRDCTSTFTVDTALEVLRTKVDQYLMNSSRWAHHFRMNKVYPPRPEKQRDVVKQTKDQKVS